MMEAGPEIRKGAPISIAWDKEGGVDYINIRDQDEKLILKVRKSLWDNGAGAEFTPEIRDTILSHARGLFG